MGPLTYTTLASQACIFCCSCQKIFNRMSSLSKKTTLSTVCTPPVIIGSRDKKKNTGADMQILPLL